MATKTIMRFVLIATATFALVACDSNMSSADGVSGDERFSSANAQRAGSEAGNRGKFDRDTDGDNGRNGNDQSDRSRGDDYETGGLMGADGDGGDGVGGMDGDETGGLVGDDGDSNSGDGVGLDQIDEDLDTDCRYFMADDELEDNGLELIDVRHEIEGGPGIDVDVRKYTRSGSGHMEDGDFVFSFKSFLVNGTEYSHLDKTPRNAVFIAQRFDGIIQDANSESCEIVAKNTDNDENKREGCFLESTLITLENGKQKKVSEIERGDKVWNPVLKKAFPVTEIVRGFEKEAGLIEVGIQNKVVVVTATHPFLTKTGVKQAEELTKVDQLIGTDGKFHTIAHLKHRPLDPSTKVANLTIGGNKGNAAAHMVLADGVVSGDLHLQVKTERERKFNKLNQRLSRIVK